MEYTEKFNYYYEELQKAIRDRSHLTKVPVVDKNGHTRMVYKKMNKKDDNTIYSKKTTEQNMENLNKININAEDLKYAVTELKLKDPAELLISFEDYTSKGKTTEELFEDLRRLATLNLAATKSYARYSSINDEIYETKNRVLKQILLNPQGIKIKTNEDKTILYLEKNSKQISFHLYNIKTRNSVLNDYDNRDHEYYDRNGNKHFAKKRTEENTLFVEDLQNIPNNGIWNEKPGDFLIHDYSKIEKLAKIIKRIEELTDFNNEFIENNEQEFYRKEREIKEKLKSINIYDYSGEDTASNILGHGGNPKNYYHYIQEHLENKLNDLKPKDETRKMREYAEKIKEAKTKKTKDKYIELYKEEKNIKLEQLNNSRLQEKEKVLNNVSDIKEFIKKYVFEANPKEQIYGSTLYMMKMKRPEYNRYVMNKKEVKKLLSEKEKLIEGILASPEFILKSL